MKLAPEQIFLPDSRNENSIESALNRLIEHGFEIDGLEFAESTPSRTSPWREDFFELHRCGLYHQLTVDQRRDLVVELCDGLLRDAYHIESAGMTYAAKMSLLARSQQERILFSLMGQEEAQHFLNLKSWFPASFVNEPPSTFSSLIARVIEDGDRRSGLFLIQVLLEGWGLFYYQRLAEMTIDTKMRKVFQQILRDETRHYSSGAVLFEACESDAASTHYIRQTLHDVLSMVRVGPQMVAQRLARASGGITSEQMRKLMGELGAVDGAAYNLRRLKVIIERSLPSSLREFCERENLFTPLSLDEMAEIAQNP